MKNFINLSMYLIIFLALPIGITAQSNLIIGGSAGVNLSKYNFTDDLKDSWTTSNTKFGLNGGLKVGLELGRIGLFTGIDYVSKGGKFETNNFMFNNGEVGFVSGEEEVGFISIPLLLRYKVLDEGFGISLSVGPTFNIGTHGTYTQVTEFERSNPLTENSTLTFGDGIRDNYKKLQMGLLINPSILFPIGESGRLSFSVGVDLGLSNAINSRFQEAAGFEGKLKNRSTIFSIGYEHLIEFGDKY